MPPSANPLADWNSFYVIVGSSGAALIGLQFVVMALIADIRPRSSARTISAFGTPTVVHFGGALLVSAIMSAPWPSLVAASIALVICGLAGLGYGAVVLNHTRHQTVYRPVWEDWLWHTILPGAAYAAIALGALFLRSVAHVALFPVGAAALTLLFVGIHNAWDTVTYLVASEAEGRAAGGREEDEPPGAERRESEGAGSGEARSDAASAEQPGRG